MRFFLKSISWALAAGFVIIFLLSLFVIFTGKTWLSISIGSVFALVFVIAGYLSYYYAISLKQKSFNIIFVISILGRISLLLIAIVLVIKFGNMNNVLFIISLFCWYFIFQICEVISFKKYSLKKV